MSEFIGVWEPVFATYYEWPWVKLDKGLPDLDTLAEWETEDDTDSYLYGGVAQIINALRVDGRGVPLSKHAHIFSRQTEIDPAAYGRNGKPYVRTIYYSYRPVNSYPDWVLQSALKNPCSAVDDPEMLLEHSDPMVRVIILQRYEVSVRCLERAACDENERVRAAAVNNPNCPAHIRAIVALAE